MAALGLALITVSCGDDDPAEPSPSATMTGPQPQTSSMPTAAASATASATAEPVVMPTPICPPDMVEVTPREVPTEPGDLERAYCVDRYEAMLVDSETSSRISPYYAPSRKQASRTARVWESLRFEMGKPRQQAIPLPTLPAWQLQKDFVPRAVARKGVTPNGHVSGQQAKVACESAGKRLCSKEEWLIACRGQRGEQFPYGSKYVRGKCNVFREAHPGHVLHGDVTIGHSDPRLNRVTYRGQPLLRKTGATKTCASRWSGDAIYDMVGNVDEWLDDPDGSFAGGFYARTSTKGCHWRSTAHPFQYADYSTGVRCCADLPAVR